MRYTDCQSLQKKKKSKKKSCTSTYALADDLEDVGGVVLSVLQRELEVATSTIVNLIANVNYDKVPCYALSTS